MSTHATSLGPFSFGRFSSSALPLTVMLCGLLIRDAQGHPPSLSRFQDQLASGEFAPALSLAQKVDDPTERDTWLGQLAVAQAKAGGPDAAYATLAQIADDRSRYSAIQSMRPSMPSAEGAPGGNQADFDSLIELITTTVRPTTWDEVGGPGTVSEFRNGVYVDAQGQLRRLLKTEKATGLATERLKALRAADTADPARFSNLRKVSLTRLEKYVQLALAAGRQPTEEMLHLAGLQRIKYVFVYPETGDLVIAGPAGSWQLDGDRRPRGVATGRPVLQLDDLVVVLRYLSATPDGTFGCSIEPTTEGLARTRQFAEDSSSTPLRPHERGAWLKSLREQLGVQKIVVDGIDPRTRVARVLVEADYRMKLVGIGLEKGTADVPSYLDLIQVPRGQAPPPLDVLRWWFTLKYDALRATEDRTAFEIHGQGVQVMSENEMLTALGRRVHTGKSDPTNADFAGRFTKHFEALAEKYPVYADLQNIFDLALVASLLQSERLAERVGWHLTCFADPQQYVVRHGPAPSSVQSVINHRIIHQKHIVVGVSGGVHVAPQVVTRREAIKIDTYGALSARRKNATQADLPLGSWWWD